MAKIPRKQIRGLPRLTAADVAKYNAVDSRFNSAPIADGTVAIYDATTQRYEGKSYREPVRVNSPNLLIAQFNQPYYYSFSRLNMLDCAGNLAELEILGVFTETANGQLLPNTWLAVEITNSAVLLYGQPNVEGLAVVWLKMKGAFGLSKTTDFYVQVQVVPYSTSIVDFIFSNRLEESAAAYNDFAFRVQLDTPDMSQKGESATLANRTVRPFSSTAPEDVFLIAPLAKSQGIQPTVSSYRFGFNWAKMREIYPNTNEFRAKIYAARQPNNDLPSFYARVSIYSGGGLVAVNPPGTVGFTFQGGVGYPYTDHAPQQVLPFSPNEQLMGRLVYRLNTNQVTYEPT